VSAPAVLITRPEAQSRALAAELAAEGWRPLVWPLLTIAPLGRPDFAGAQAALFTSANAARLAEGAPIPALCVGAATARAARGFAETVVAEGDAAALAALARARLDPAAGPLVFARGADVSADLAGALRAAGFAVREQVVYEARPADAAPPEVAGALAGGGLAAALFYSARTAEAFARLAGPWRAALGGAAAVAISAAAAAPLGGAGFARVLTAARPDDAAMRAALATARPKGAGD
jgi:uroporphyrinogen-III synthase